MTSSIDLSFLIKTTKKDKNFIQGILLNVLLQMEEFLAVVQQLVIKEDYVMLASEIHKFKSSMQIIGAIMLYEKLQLLEAASKNKNSMGIEQLSIMVKGLVYNTKKEVANQIETYKLS